MKIEVAYSSETAELIYNIIQCDNPEDHKSNMGVIAFWA
jgi:hypothetical protein